VDSQKAKKVLESAGYSVEVKEDGQTLVVRDSKKNGLFSRAEKQQFKRRLKQKIKSGARRGLAKLFRHRNSPPSSASAPKLSGLRADVVSALINQGWKRADAQRAAAAASGNDFNSLFRDALKQRKNPARTFYFVKYGGGKYSRGFGTKAAAQRYAKRTGGTIFTAGPARKKRKRNGDPALDKAAAVFRKFHGADPNKVIEIEEQLKDSGQYAQLGQLLQLDMYHGPELNCRNAGIRLCSDPDGNQLCCIGGNQDIEAGLGPMFGLNTNARLVDLGEINKVWYLAQKSMHGFEPIEYHHRFGEEGGSRPRLMYDRDNKKLFIIGGDYEIKAVGIKN
ncbi:MAG TPA: hypothetical protein VJN64_11765, partial [Terriglobales bacterium]|nr:hypothetical protein [Terriglobales bacterium]